MRCSPKPKGGHYAKSGAADFQTQQMGSRRAFVEAAMRSYAARRRMDRDRTATELTNIRDENDNALK